MSDVKQIVDKKIGSKKVVVYSKSWCPYCTKAKKCLVTYKPNVIKNEDYEEIEIEDDPNCEAYQQYFAKLTGARSVPRVFVNGKCIGGGDDVESLHKSGKLKAILSS